MTAQVAEIGAPDPNGDNLYLIPTTACAMRAWSFVPRISDRVMRQAERSVRRRRPAMGSRAVAQIDIYQRRGLVDSFPVAA